MRIGEWNTTHGYTRGKTAPGGHKSAPVYTAWLNMRSRCDNRNRPDYENYGGRGIYYSPRWIRFENFLADMGEPPPGTSIDRIDNDGPYYPANCRWASRAEQNLNKRNCVRYEFEGENLTLPEWARKLGINRTTLLERVRKGWDIRRVLTTPLQTARGA